MVTEGDTGKGGDTIQVINERRRLKTRQIKSEEGLFLADRIINLKAARGSAKEKIRSLTWI